MVAKMREVAVWTTDGSVWELIIPGTPYSPGALQSAGTFSPLALAGPDEVHRPDPTPSTGPSSLFWHCAHTDSPRNLSTGQAMTLSVPCPSLQKKKQLAIKGYVNNFQPFRWKMSRGG